MKLGTIGICELCKVQATLINDHCHIHGYIRGTLCKGCNYRIGPGRYGLFYSSLIIRLGGKYDKRTNAYKQAIARIMAYIRQCPACENLY
jgi:hypothetical protein